MSVKTTADDRRKFYERHLQGETYAEIAAARGVSVGCVRYWCRRLRAGGSCVSHYHQPVCGILCRFDPLVRYGILRLRLEHPRWGPSRIRYHLAQRAAVQRRRLRLPAVAQIGRYLQQWPRLRRRTRPPAVVRTRPDRPERVFQRWQLDFKLGLRLTDGSQVNLHTLRDVVGEVCLAARVTPAGPRGRKPWRVSLCELQATLRAAAAHWHTLPEEVQTDNEAVFVGSTGDAFPGAFTLWLVGLGIRHLTIQPGQPTQNAAVERCHQTLCNYAVSGNEHCDCQQLQQVLDQAVAELACDLPSQAQGCQGQPPVRAHPQLRQPTRRFVPEHEWQAFDLARVDAYLASGVWQRMVGKTGQVCIGGHHQYYSVGRAYAGQIVWVCFDPADRHFVFFDPQPPYAEIGRRPARNLDKAALTGLIDPDCQAVPQQLALFDLTHIEG
jgi:transposase InsO family protein